MEKQADEGALWGRLPTVVLIGLMGAGKTSLGHGLSARLGVPFVDSDDVIAARAGMGIPEIFRTQGEAVFRALERDVLADLLNDGVSRIVATGGGAVMTPAVADLVFQPAVLSLWLRADLDETLRRVAAPETVGQRPLLRDNPEGVLRELMVKRYPVYGRATWALDTTGRTPGEVVDDAAQVLREYLQGHVNA